MILCISFEWHCAKFLLMLNVWWVISVLKLLKDFPNIVCNKWCSLSTLKWKIVLTSLLSLFMLLMCYAQLAHKLLYLRILPGKMDLDQQHLYYTFLPLNRTCVSCCIPKTKGITPFNSFVKLIHEPLSYGLSEQPYHLLFMSCALLSHEHLYIRNLNCLTR